ncbi:MAG: peptidylprolyl isomerase [Planctomycetes bacterium]|nr:peptidylprolyl isomerase [Planctomycetota bacterium]
MPILVNGERIDEAEIDSEVQRLRPHYEQYVQAEDETDQAGDAQLRQWARENVIERALVFQAARKLDVDIPAEEIDKAYEEIKDRAGDAPAERVKADIELRMRVDELMERNVPAPPEPSEEELQAFYRENIEAFTSPEQVRASHIVKHVYSPEDRKKAYEEVLTAKMALAEGASFEEQVRLHSDCPENDGDLGLFGRGQMVQEFEDVVFNMQVGQVSDVFETQFGYHLVKLYEHRAARTAPFEQVRDDIAKELMDRRRQEAVETFLDTLRKEATIEEIAGESPGDETAADAPGDETAADTPGDAPAADASAAGDATPGDATTAGPAT